MGLFWQGRTGAGGLRALLTPWWEAFQGVWRPFLLARLGLLLWAAVLAVAIGSVDDFGRVSQAAWPPAAPWGQWLEQVLLRPWLHYDVHHYLMIVAKGFAGHPQGAVFYPLHPMCIWAVSRVLGHPLATAMLLNVLAHLGLVVCLYRYVGEEFSAAVGRWAVISLLTFPLAFLLAVPYSEAPFLVFVVLAFWAARRRNWLVAGVAGLLAAAFRQPGLLLLPALGLEWLLWAIRERRWRAWLAGLWLALIPLAPYAFAFYLHSLDITQVPPWHPLSPLLWVNEVQGRYWHSTFVMPWTTVGMIAQQLSGGLGGPMLIDLLGTVVLTLLALGSLWAWRRPGLTGYTLLMILASWTKVLGPPSASPIESFPRHLMVIFPIYLLLGRALERWRLARVAWLVLSPLLLLLHSALFIRNAWIP